MSDIKTISLEIVRAGPTHNQLLSPLTRYLALCGDFPATTLSVGHDHRYFMRRLKELEYPRKEHKDEEDEKRRRAALDELGLEIAELLGQVPGLPVGLANAKKEGAPFTHLQLVMSAAELALLPFELTAIPNACPGGEKSRLVLQNEVPLCMTRQVRSVSKDHAQWPDKPNILFIAGLPGGENFPLMPHIQALLKNIMPWTQVNSPVEDPTEGGLRDKVKDNLTILPDASIYDVVDICRHNAYTHIHVLAHGVEDSSSEGRQIGLAMRGATGGMDIVTGDRLATALKTTRIVEGKETTSMPTVATLATCHSGKIEDLMYSGASFAHELHQAGVPLVVASQFPLSFEGSVHMVEVLYRKLLWGEDPRTAIHTLRRKLYALRSAKTHDWASLIAYTSLPSNLEQQLERTQYSQARRAMNVAVKQINEMMDLIKPKEEDEDEIQRIETAIEKGIKRLNDATKKLPVTGAYGTECKGLLGATEKRKAEIAFKLALRENERESRKTYKNDDMAKKSSADFMNECLETIRKSRGYYWEAVQNNLRMSKDTMQMKTSRHWALVQYLCLGAVMGEPLHTEHWFTAKASAQLDASTPDTLTQAEAHSSLAELYLLLMAYSKEVGAKSTWKLLHPMTKKTHIRRHAEEHIRAVVDLISGNEDQFIIIDATRRQLWRYYEWWGTKLFEDFLGNKRPSWRGKDGVISLARAMERILRNAPGTSD